MTDERWRRNIQVEPNAETTHTSADRARGKALERFDRVSRSRSSLRWPAVAMAIAFTLILWITTITSPVEAPPAAISGTHPTRVQFVLSDGTKVQWVFHDRFGL